MKALSKAKRIWAIIILVVVVFFLIVGIINMVFAILGNQKQVGTAVGYEWNKDMAFDESKVLKTIDMGNDDFKILGIADIQRKNSGTAVKFLGINYLLDWVSEPQIKKMVKEIAPDLIVLMGDTVATKTVNDLELKFIADFMDKLEVPWTVIFGNHDDEGRADKATIVDIFMESKYCIFEFGPADLHGAGNFVINLTRNGNIEYSIYLMDSGNHIERDGKSGYDGINAKQVEWYNWTSAGINAIAGKTVKNMAFLHIPLPEYNNIQDSDIILGSRSEAIYASIFNDGFFNAFKANSGTHVWVGHDHSNNFAAMYEGVQLGYVQKSSYNGSYNAKKVGGTIITIKSDNQVESKLYNF